MWAESGVDVSEPLRPGSSSWLRCHVCCRAEALASADTRTLKRARYGETQTAEQFPQRRSVRLEADIRLVRLKPDTTYNRKTL